uniref:Uncharacterized protein n=1 Tax=Glossina austeni TaxID=7395 RepID=A0A1A9UFX1_GLOAU
MATMMKHAFKSLLFSSKLPTRRPSICSAVNLNLGAHPLRIISNDCSNCCRVTYKHELFSIDYFAYAKEITFDLKVETELLASVASKGHNDSENTVQNTVYPGHKSAASELFRYQKSDFKKKIATGVKEISPIKTDVIETIGLDIRTANDHSTLWYRATLPTFIPAPRKSISSFLDLIWTNFQIPISDVKALNDFRSNHLLVKFSRIISQQI